MSNLTAVTEASLAHSIVTSATGGTLYLVSQRVQPGDVLLTGGRARFSLAIERLTGGPFSHAALLESHLRLYEALLDGIGPTNLPVGRIEGNEEELLYLRPLVGHTALLLRHPALAQLAYGDRMKLLQVIGEVMHPYVGMRYPTLYKLANALPPRNPLRLFYDTFQRQLQSALPPQDLEGPFCSAMVALVFDKLGLSLLGRGESVDALNPNGLLHSGLHIVEGAIVVANDAEDGMPDLVRGVNDGNSGFLSREREIEGNRARLEAMKSVKEFLDELDRFSPRVEAYLDDIRKAIRIVNQQQQTS
jgi:hypothetical protein